ncbi:MAG TPA: hypothetical protein ENI08_00515 [Candidatus Dependentiae bacterium]|nr:hypothetical protein [Candidatus Dependentiae bacterium]
MYKESRYTQSKPKIIAPEKMLGRNLPASIEAERSVLGALLLNDENINQVAELLLPHDFYNPSHKVIYEAMLNLVQQNKRIDLITLQDELVKREQLESIGGIVYLVSLQEDIPAVGLIKQHAKIIKEKATLRELISSAATIITNCYDQNDENIEAVLDEAEKTIFNISNKRTNQSFVQLNIWLKKTFQHLSDIKSHSKGITGVPSGYKKLDQILS